MRSMIKQLLLAKEACFKIIEYVFDTTCTRMHCLMEKYNSDQSDKRYYLRQNFMHSCIR